MNGRARQLQVGSRGVGDVKASVLACVRREESMVPGVSSLYV